jgi:nucleoside-diphosphate-sugar epimerase
MRIFFTGGSGKAGRHVLPWLAERGHRILNVDRVPLGHPGIHDLIADVTDIGDVYSAMSGWAGYAELDTPRLPTGNPPPFDAVVHFAAVPRMLMTSDAECFRVNTVSTYNVIEAALRLGIRKIVIASSETTYGICFTQGEVMPRHLPVDEEHPTVPHDSYAMSKVVNEVTARSFQARSGADIYALRINNVIEPHEYAQDFPRYAADPALRRRNVFAYIDARDLGQMVDLCLKADGLGYQVFNVSNDDHSVDMDTEAIIARFYPGVPVRTALGRRETLYSNRKAREMLGFAPRHNWRWGAES